MTVRTRFAPSPTGYLHIGGARTALFSYLFARRHGGQFVLRIEDTDRARSTDESVQAILDGMSWLGLEADEGPFFQTERFDRYREVVQELLAKGHAYRCWSTPEEVDAMREKARSEGRKPRYDGTWRDSTETPPSGIEPVVRFRNPLEGSVVIDDAVKGEIVIDNGELDDLVILRADGSPTYNLTVVVDDMDMRISHVIRGDDHVNNTPRQINILEALGAPRPVYAHLPMILGEDGKRLSKRHGAVSVMQYAADGYLPDALLNYLVRLGWSHGDQELFSAEEMSSLFALEQVNRSGAVFDTKKLDWINQHYLQAMPADALALALAPYLAARLAEEGVVREGGPTLAAVADLLRERAKTLVDMANAALYFYRPPAEYDAKAAAKQFVPTAGEILEAARARLAALDAWTAADIQSALEATVAAQEVGFGKLGQPLRLAITGTTASPAMNEVLELLGQTESVRRIETAIVACSAAAS